MHQAVMPISPPPADDRSHAQQMAALKQAQDAKVKAASTRRGIVVVHTGNGKGKSTAAYGMLLRTIGHGKRVGLVQFIKGTWRTGEKQAIASLPLVDHVVSGDGFTWDTQDRAQDILSARRGWEAAVDMIEACRGENPKYHLVILDELNIALRYNYIPVQEVVAALQNKPERLNVVITGRDAPAEVIAVADTVTEMHENKHAFAAGIKAQIGVDF